MRGWAFVVARREAELAAIIGSEGLRTEETAAFDESALHDGAIRAPGTAVTKVLPPVSLRPAVTVEEAARGGAA